MADPVTDLRFMRQELDRADEERTAARARIAELERENAWLRRLIQWCRMRLRRDGYMEQLDTNLAGGVTEPDTTQAALSSNGE